jgi:alginate O-acetyltransferase complex protein AlgI
MLFNSFEFIFLFLPLALLIFFALGGYFRPLVATAWLVFASLFFYGWWNPGYLALILVSIVFNFFIGYTLVNHRSKILLAFGIAMNLGLLGYFKYFDFLVTNLNTLAGTTIRGADIVLPLAISFFTFQQIAYLVDVYKGEVEEHGFTRYALFVSFFPQLIAGPIVHHKEMLPQFSESKTYRWSSQNLALGVSIFVVGLFKKVIIADHLAVYAIPVFHAGDSGSTLSFFEAWGGALAYTFQLYFDFSGYSDMAIGLARMFGIALPINFNSPYKATSVIDFWRRWHMTLSRFLRDYLYIPLGGNREGKVRRYANVMITMILGGLWHGASWTFVAWGMLHGFYVLVNHGWRFLRRYFGFPAGFGFPGRLLAIMLTFVCVVIAWVFFRAETFSGAIAILEGMAGLNGVVLDSRFNEYLPGGISFIEYSTLPLGAFGSVTGILWILLGGLVVWGLPSTQVLFALERPSKLKAEGLPAKLLWRAKPGWGFSVVIMATLVIMSLHDVSEFLYFNF